MGSLHGGGDDEADEQRPFKSNGKPEREKSKLEHQVKKSQTMTLNGLRKNMLSKQKSIYS